jgi:hypothetical protein
MDVAIWEQFVLLFVKIIWIFYDSLIDTKYFTIVIFTIFR